MARILTEYVFESGGGRASLHDLFDGRRRLIVDHFPFDPLWAADCGRSSHLAERLAAGVADLPGKNTSFAAVSAAPISKIVSCQDRLGWTFPWLSSLGSTFHDDFRPGLSVFVCDDGDVFHAYSTPHHRLDAIGAYGSSDAKPLFRRNPDLRS